MAIDITVSLTDAEQALVQELALKVAPGATIPEVLAWVQQQCKRGLRDAVVRKWNEMSQAEASALVAARYDRAAADFPEVT
jgi:hypothetical protein